MEPLSGTIKVTDDLIAGRPVRRGVEAMRLVGVDHWYVERTTAPPSQTLFYLEGNPDSTTINNRYHIQSDYVGGPCSSFEDLQAWVMLNWQYPIGSLEAAVHVYHKFTEEVAELLQAVESGDLAGVRGEIGDVCWTAIAMALGEGVQFSGIIDGNEQEIIAGDAHRFARTYFASALERYSMEDLLCECARLYKKRVRIHRALTKKIYRLDSASRMDPMPTTFEEVCIKSELSDILLLLSLFADEADSTLLDCVELTRVKLEARIAANQAITKPATSR